MTNVAVVYAQALYSLVKEEGRSEPVLKELAALNESFAAEPDFVRLLSACNITKEERCRILDEGFRGKVDQYVLNFMKILTEKGYMRYFADCCKEYRTAYNRDHGILEVFAVTAVALSKEQSDRLSITACCIVQTEDRYKDGQCDRSFMGRERRLYRRVCKQDIRRT